MTSRISRNNNKTKKNLNLKPYHSLSVRGRRFTSHPRYSSKLNSSKLTQRDRGISSIDKSFSDFGNKFRYYKPLTLSESKKKDNADTQRYESIIFSADILEYLIINNNFNVIKPTKYNNDYYKLSINTDKLPIINLFFLNYIDSKLYINVKLHNLFDVVHFFDNTFENDIGRKTIEEPIINLSTYNNFIEKLKEIYNIQYKNLLQPKIQIKEYDKLENNKIYFPCESYYGFKEGAISEEIIKNDFIFFEEKAPYVTIKEAINIIYYEDKYESEIDFNTTCTYFDKPSGRNKLYEYVIHKKIKHEDPNKEYLILGIPLKDNLSNTYFIYNSPNYNEILESQKEQFEELIKKYTLQETTGTLTESDYQIGDYILHKKKIAGVDFDYIKNNNLLNAEQIDQLKKYVRYKLTEMCKDKFNKPNLTLAYIWNIFEITIPKPPKNEINISTITTIRQINDNHTELLEEILRLSRTEMLFKANIIDEGETYNQVYNDIDLNQKLYIKSYYTHPLNYKTRHYGTENKLFTLEQLIEYSKLKCDGTYPGMEKYKGIPLCAVLPIEITVNSRMINSVFYYNKIDCNSRKESNRSFLSVQSKTMKNKFQPSQSQTQPITNAQNNTYKYVINKTKIIQNSSSLSVGTNATHESNMILLTKLFRNESGNKNLRILSCLNTPNGLIFGVLYDSIENKFYYIVLEVDIKTHIMPEFKKDDTQFMFKYNVHNNSYNSNNSASNKINVPIRLVYLYHAKDKPIINILVIKEFTKGDKTFTILGNENIYKKVGNMHEFFQKDMLEYNYSQNQIEKRISIPNPYRYYLISLINIINSLPDNVKKYIKKINIEHKKLPNIRTFYRVAKKNDDNTYDYKMINESMTHEPGYKINWEGIIDKRKESEIIGKSTQFPNNTVFMTIGNEYIMLLNKFWDDELKTKYIPSNKQQLNKHFKFTGWCITRDYFLECIKIYDDLKVEDELNPNKIFHKLSDDMKNNILYHISSINNNNECIKELTEHIELHTKYITDNIISLDKTLCKDYKPSIIINPVSDLSSSILHLHFMQDILHFNPLKLINLKQELLIDNMPSIYDLYSANSYSKNKIINQLQTNNDSIFNKPLINPYLPALKLSAILSGIILE